MAQPADLMVILIAPNVSEQMGGEAIKSYQIYRELAQRGLSVLQITHARCRDELSTTTPSMKVEYVENGPFQRFLWAVPPCRLFVPVVFEFLAAKIAKRIVKQHPGAVIHHTGPVSPVLPVFTVRTPTVIGPLNGNITYPPGFQEREPSHDRLRRVALRWLQTTHRWFFPGKRRAEVLLVAGGQRTYDSLLIAGCRTEQFVDSIDSGIPDRLRDRPRNLHHGENFRFVHNGSLVPHKGTDLIIKAVAACDAPLTLDIIGKGFNKPALETLVGELGVGDRVRFLDWVADHRKLADVLAPYRAFVFPSLAEANGIVVQEAMAMGLPVICLNWGGPGLLVDPTCGVLIEPKNETYVVDQLAEAMERLARDGILADAMAESGHELAFQKGFYWAQIIDGWIEIYHDVRDRH